MIARGISTVKNTISLDGTANKGGNLESVKLEEAASIVGAKLQNVTAPSTSTTCNLTFHFFSLRNFD